MLHDCRVTALLYETMLYVRSAIIEHVLICSHSYVVTIDIKKVDNQLTHEMHVKDGYENYTLIDKLTKWH